MKNSIIMVLLMLLLIGCGDVNKTKTKKEVETFYLDSKVEKGPFVNGTLTIAECNVSETIDADGIVHATPCTTDEELVTINANGQYFNEVTGQNTSEKITLVSIVEPSADASANANVITTAIALAVEEDTRDIADVDKVEEYNISIEKHTRIFLDLFGLGNYTDSIVNPTFINFNTDYSDLLLAISAIVQGDRTVGEVEILLGRIGTDLKNGVITQDLKDELYSDRSRIVPDSIEMNMSIYGEYDIDIFYQAFLDKWLTELPELELFPEAFLPYGVGGKVFNQADAYGYIPIYDVSRENKVANVYVGKINVTVATKKPYDIKVNLDTTSCKENTRIRIVNFLYSDPDIIPDDNFFDTLDYSDWDFGNLHVAEFDGNGSVECLFYIHSETENSFDVQIVFAEYNDFDLDGIIQTKDRDIDVFYW